MTEIVPRCAPVPRSFGFADTNELDTRCAKSPTIWYDVNGVAPKTFFDVALVRVEAGVMLPKGNSAPLVFLCFS